MNHICLLGDSIFDNGAYVGAGPDVARQLRERVPGDCRVTLLAVDGAVMADVTRQISRIPEDATHLVLSVGGNDALGQIGSVDLPARSVADTLDLLADLGDAFRSAYSDLVERLLESKLPLTLCTIYEGALPDPVFRRRAATALNAFNDAIIRTAFSKRLTLIDLRLVCSDPRDYANPIEPSVRGGARIAEAIAGAVGAREAPESSSVFW
jgi:hypothetical protein